ncbi:MAG: hypothetical protein Q9225_003304 [Loekoesia sp. 1 TL-2023]
MQLHQYHAHSAPSLNTSVAERPRPPVPRFSESTGSLPQPSLDMAGFDNMQGKHFPGSSPSISPLTSFESASDSPWNDFGLGPESGLEMAGPSIGGEYLSGVPGSTGSFTPLEHTSSTESQTISPSEMHISAPASGALTYQSTPQTDYIDSPTYFSNDTSPAWPLTESPVVNDNWEYGQNMPNYQMFPDLPGEDKKEVTTSEPVIKKSFTMSRKGSSPGTASPSSRPSGIKKKSRGPLPDIVVDPNDPVAVKRGRNTQAARNSRKRKEEYVKALKQECEMWKRRAIAAGWPEEDEQQDVDLV